MALRPSPVKANLSKSPCRRWMTLATGRGRPYFIFMDIFGPHFRRVSGQTYGSKIMATGTNRILDDFARLMTDAAGAAQGVRKEFETAFHAQAERFLNNMDVVKREEFEAVREMAARARDENEALKARIEALEAKLSGQ